MRSLSVLLLTILLVSCGAIEKNCGGDLKRECDNVFGHDYDKRSQDNSDKIASLDDKLANLKDVVAAQDVRIDMLEIVTELHGNLISINTNAINNILIPDLNLLENRLYNLEVNVNSDINSIRSELIVIKSNIDSIEETIKKNDEYVDIPGCEHSYFTLYSANGNILDMYITENDGTVGGAWKLNNNSTYSLQIAGQILCTGVKYSKSNKELYFNNGSNQIINLSY